MITFSLYNGLNDKPYAKHVLRRLTKVIKRDLPDEMSECSISPIPSRTYRNARATHFGLCKNAVVQDSTSSIRGLTWNAWVIHRADASHPVCEHMRSSFRVFNQSTCFEPYHTSQQTSAFFRSWSVIVNRKDDSISMAKTLRRFASRS